LRWADSHKFDNRRKKRVDFGAAIAYVAESCQWFNQLRERKMTTSNFASARRDYERIEAAIAYIEAHFSTQPQLSEIAAHAGLSEFHFQRLFSRWVGISPKRFLQYLTKEYAKELLKKSHTVLDAAYDAGLSGPGRLHDLFVACEAVTPGEYKSSGNGLNIVYGFYDSPFGECLMASTERGICGLFFVRNGNRRGVLAELTRIWHRASLTEDGKALTSLTERIFSPTAWNPDNPLPILLKGTNFQIKVWEALLRIPAGAAVTYQDVAAAVGDANAVRAVGTAVGKNPISYLIPCHRVIRKNAEFGNYGGGTARKKAILGWEAVQASERTAQSA
jgi:AraC family transcriptional regulator of adaptative response/methylated-DNA-[protein]-cysteine methyltransferase